MAWSVHMHPNPINGVEELTIFSNETPVLGTNTFGKRDLIDQWFIELGIQVPAEGTPMTVAPKPAIGEPISNVRREAINAALSAIRARKSIS